MTKFVYVFNEDDKKKLSERGLVLIKNDVRNSLYVFAINMSDNFALEILEGLGKYSFTNKLTF